MWDIKEINIKNGTNYFFNDMINIEGFDSNLLKLDKTPHKNIDICYIRYITIKDFDYVKINSVTPYIIIDKADRYIVEKIGNKYLTFASADKIKEVLKNYTELWDEIKYQIKTINDGKPIEYKKYFRKIKFSSDVNLSLNKILNFLMLTVVVISVFEEHGSPQVFSDEYLFEL